MHALDLCSRTVYVTHPCSLSDQRKLRVRQKSTYFGSERSPLKNRKLYGFM